LVDSKDMETLKLGLEEFLSKKWNRKDISEIIREKLLKYA
jgi:hypothetical protein